jgi:hypothetical protein
MVLNGTTEIRGTLGEISGAHTTMLTAIWLQTLVPLEQGDTVELRARSALPMAILRPTTPASGAARSAEIDRGASIIGPSTT